MSTNLMELLKDQVLGSVTGQLGKQLGESEDATRGGLDALLPTVLGGLMKKASDPGGLEQLNQTLDSDEYDGGLLDKVGGMLSGDSSGISNMGSGLVSMIFGDKIGAIMGLISKFTGMGGKSTSGLLGLALPLIMSFLGKQKRSMGLDANGFASLLMDQKDHVAKALPPGISDEMGLGALGIASPADKTSAPNPPSPSPSPAGLGIVKVLATALLIGALGYIGYTVLNKDDKKDIEQVDDDLLDLGADDFDLGEIEIPGLTEMSDRLTAQLEKLDVVFTGVESKAIAEERLPELKIIDAKLGEIAAELEGKSEAFRNGLAVTANKLVQPLNSKIYETMANSDVSPVLMKTAMKLQPKLNQFRQAGGTPAADPK